LKDSLTALSKDALFSLRDLAPIVVVIAVFQIFVIKQPVDGILSLVFGGLLVVAGLACFIFGLRIALFPIGEGLAHALAKKGSAFWLFTFSFVLGFGTTIAEPSLLAVANEAARVAVDAGVIEDTDEAIAGYALGLRLVVALSVGVALLLGVLRIITNWSLPLMIIAGYVLVIIVTTMAPPEIVGVAYDSGGVSNGIGRGTGGFAQRAKSDDRRLRPDCFCIVDAHPFCSSLRHRDAMDMIIEAIMFIFDTAMDVAPIVLFLFAFQLFVIRERIPNLRQILVGFGFVVVGLGLFLVGLEESLFPLGRLMAQQLTDPGFIAQVSGHIDRALVWQDFYWVYLFAAALGFSTTLAEPALMAVAIKANAVSGGAIGVWGLRVAVAIGAGIGVALGCFRIITGLPLQYFIAAGYLMVILQTALAPKMIVPLAYDSGGVTTSTVTVPLIAALGLGLAEAVPGRSPLLDGFGLVAFAALFPIISVLAYGQLAVLREKTSKAGQETRMPRRMTSCRRRGMRARPVAR
jgi:hypothetical protein